MASSIQFSLCLGMLMVCGSFAGPTGETGETGAAGRQVQPNRCYGYSWGRWGACSVTCGTGTQRRSCNRISSTCYDRAADPEDRRVIPGRPAPQIPPFQCRPGSTQTQRCRRSPCPTLPLTCGPVHGRWSSWGCWSECRNGRRQRHRECNRPAPSGWGRICPGRSYQIASCHVCAAGQDIVFAIDGSGSIGRDNYQTMMNDLNTLVHLFDLDTGSSPSSSVRVGVELFNSRAIWKKWLNQFHTPNFASYAYPNGGTNIAAAITYAHRSMFVQARGDRPNNPNTLVLITDGYSPNPISAANAAKAAGIKILVVGVGNRVNRPLLEAIASNKDTDVFLATDFCEIRNYLTKRFDCDVQALKPADRKCSGTRPIAGPPSRRGPSGDVPKIETDFGTF